MSRKRKQRRTRPNSTSRRQPRPRPSSRVAPSKPPPNRPLHRPTVTQVLREPTKVEASSTARTRGPQTRNLGSGPLGPPPALGSTSPSTSTPTPALVTKATSKVPHSPRDTRRHPSRAHSTPTNHTATEAPRTALQINSRGLSQT